MSAHDVLPTLSSYVDTCHPAPVVDEDALPAAQSGDPLPPLRQWLYFHEWPRQSELGPDGHLREARSLPPIPRRRRMFAGGRLDVAERMSSLHAVTPQTRAQRRAAVRHRAPGVPAVRPRLSRRGAGIVHRSGRGAGERHPEHIDTTARPEAVGTWRLALQPDERLLFRISALTANAHRIQLELVRRHAPERQLCSLSYRLRRPVFAGGHIAAAGAPTADGAELSLATARERRHATAEVTFSRAG
ncbi:hypothetical protein [Streptomyces sp. NL15-2K]|uniref:hypothetical protein n=1 Tax=Streptomyces sp. NL15-2K TaxID=376149 RepID=UPI00209C2CE4|nr:MULTISPECIES: hypothetical protein [Actinomycetes]WKX15425.1 hypothetical protein Q4V64_51200 [Kutzneria buriramensis]